MEARSARVAVATPESRMVGCGGTMPVACHDKTLPSYWRFNCSEVDKIESSTPRAPFSMQRIFLIARG
jgi:hypothetical protein